jgi:hypothetical protein
VLKGAIPEVGGVEMKKPTKKVFTEEDLEDLKEADEGKGTGMDLDDDEAWGGIGGAAAGGDESGSGSEDEEEDSDDDAPEEATMGQGKEEARREEEKRIAALDKSVPFPALAYDTGVWHKLIRNVFFFRSCLTL